MFIVENKDMIQILHDYHINGKLIGIAELQRYYYEEDNPDSKEVRLIVRVDLEEMPSVVMRFKNEKDVSIELIESQCQFAETMKNSGITTPTQYKAEGKFAKWYHIGGYDVIVTIEEFVSNEIKVVDAAIAKKTGELLARMHTISEQQKLHVDNEVLFNPFTHNDLFAYDAFLTIQSMLEKEDQQLFEEIVEKYHAYMDILAPLKLRPRYAVQGDISQCNLYCTRLGEVGIFDFNRSGDNILFCDAIMQAVFEARLMDYPGECGIDYEIIILKSFLEGYCSIRSFSEEEQHWYLYLLAIIHAFWSVDICWSEKSLLNVCKKGETEGVHQWLLIIKERLEISV